MAYQVFPGGGGLWYPPPVAYTTLQEQGSAVMDASGESYYVRFIVPKTGNIKAIGFRVNAFTQCTNGLTLAVQHPSLTAVGPDAGDHSTGTVAVTATGWYTCTLDAVQAVTRGEDIGVVFRFTTWAAGNNIGIGAFDYPGFTRCTPTPCQYLTSWLAKGWLQQLAVQYDDDSYIKLDVHTVPFNLLASERTYEFSTPNEVGLVIRFPAKVKADAVWVSGGIGSTQGRVRLYDEASTLKASGNLWDIDNVYNTGGGYYTESVLDTEVEIPANTNYRLALKAESGGSVYLAKATVSAAALLDAWAGQAWCKTSRKDAGAWTDVATETYLMGLRVTQIDDGAGAAGGGLPILGGSVVR